MKIYEDRFGKEEETIVMDMVGKVIDDDARKKLQAYKQAGKAVIVKTSPCQSVDRPAGTVYRYTQAAEPATRMKQTRVGHASTVRRSFSKCKAASRNVSNYIQNPIPRDKEQQLHTEFTRNGKRMTRTDWSQFERHLAEQMLINGSGYADIARKLGRTYISVYRKIQNEYNRQHTLPRDADHPIAMIRSGLKVL